MEQMRKKIPYYFEVVKKVVVVIKFLIERGLIFRGLEEKWDSPKYKNFIEVSLNLFQSLFLYEHLKKFKKCYLPVSKTLYEELI